MAPKLAEKIDAQLNYSIQSALTNFSLVKGRILNSYFYFWLKYTSFLQTLFCWSCWTTQCTFLMTMTISHLQRSSHSAPFKEAQIYWAESLPTFPCLSARALRKDYWMDSSAIRLMSIHLLMRRQRLDCRGEGLHFSWMPMPSMISIHFVRLQRKTSSTTSLKNSLKQKNLRRSWSTLKQSVKYLLFAYSPPFSFFIFSSIYPLRT